jgi:hypothetical protein
MPAMLLALALSISTAQAGEQEVVLVCNGTLTTRSPQGETIGHERTSQGVIVNFGDRTIRGLAGYLVEITESDDTVIGFSGREQTSYTFQRTDGTMDRVTGDLHMSEKQWEKKKPGGTTLTKEALALIRTTYYELKCKPTQRMF